MEGATKLCWHAKIMQATLKLFNLLHKRIVPNVKSKWIIKEVTRRNAFSLSPTMHPTRYSYTLYRGSKPPEVQVSNKLELRIESLYDSIYDKVSDLGIIVAHINALQIADDINNVLAIGLLSLLQKK